MLQLKKVNFLTEVFRHWNKTRNFKRRRVYGKGFEKAKKIMSLQGKSQKLRKPIYTQVKYTQQ